MQFDIADTYSTPPQALPQAIDWLASLFTGTIATVAATLAIAGVGLAMLQGRLVFRSGLRVVCGCFVLFGAPYIARQLTGVAPEPSAPVAVYSAPPAMTPVIPPAPVVNNDPNSGASVPMQ